MANVTLSPDAGVDARTTMYAQQVTGLVLAEDVDAGMALYIGTNWKLYKASSASARFDGIAPKKMRAGQPCVAFGVGTRFHATDADLDVTKSYWLSSTAGLFADTGTGAPVARCVSRHDLEIVRVGSLS